MTLSSTPPTEVNNGASASRTDLATFAWEEFIALNWPAKPRANPGAGEAPFFRGQPDTTSNIVGADGSGTVVWETYRHRAEVYAANIAAVQQAAQYTPPMPGANPGADQLPPFDAAVGYGYAPFVTLKPGAGSPSLTLFNNLDEGNEIKFANMFYTPFATSSDQSLVAKSPLAYEARMNQVEFDYIRSNGLQDSTVRSAAAARTKTLLTTNVPASAPAYPPTYIDFPDNSIEVKATWRFYDETVDGPDALTRYHSTTAITYTSSDTDLIYSNDTMLLIGLHIIQKTDAFPSFTFSTFEHVDNVKDGAIFMNILPNNPTGFRTAIRQHEIPSDYAAFNTSVQSQLAGSVWSNYELTGIQATPIKAVPQTPSNGNPKGPEFQEYFLANFVTETNSSLQYFTGGRDADNLPEPGVTNTYVANANGQYEPFVTGGCMGCHGFGAQAMGFDFSFLAANAPVRTPDALEVYKPSGAVTPQDASNIMNAAGMVVINPVTPQPLPQSDL